MLRICSKKEPEAKKRQIENGLLVSTSGFLELNFLGGRTQGSQASWSGGRRVIWNLGLLLPKTNLTVLALLFLKFLQDA